MASKREASGKTALATGEGKSAGKRSGGESPAKTPDAARPGAGPRLATGDLPVMEMGGGAAAGAIVGRLIGGGKGALLGAAVGAAAGTALGLATAGVLRRRDEPAELSREPAFGPSERAERRGGASGRARPGRDAPGGAAQAPGGTALQDPPARTAREEKPASAGKGEAAAVEEVEVEVELQEEVDAERDGRGGARGGSAQSTTGGGGRGSTDYERWTKADLYEEAKRRDIPGRSTMDKAELIRALRRR